MKLHFVPRTEVGAIRKVVRREAVSSSLPSLSPSQTHVPPHTFDYAGRRHTDPAQVHAVHVADMTQGLHTPAQAGSKATHTNSTAPLTAQNLDKVEAIRQRARPEVE